MILFTEKELHATEYYNDLRCKFNRLITMLLIDDRDEGPPKKVYRRNQLSQVERRIGSHFVYTKHTESAIIRDGRNSVLKFGSTLYEVTSWTTWRWAST